LRPTSGTVLFRGNAVWKLKKRALKEYRRSVQAVFQDPFSSFNSIYKVDHTLKTTIRKFHIADSEEEAHDRICKAVEMVKLKPDYVLAKYPHQLSGGERQRIMFARAILFNPELIIADEPVSMLDASMRVGILNEMLNLKRSYGVSFIYITHDLSTARYISDSIMILYRGGIMEMGPIDRVLDKPLHPYSQLLIDSVPVPDPNQRWDTTLQYKEEKMLTRVGEHIKKCKFYERCEKRKTECAEDKPSLVSVDGRLVACLLFSAS
jgi:peptide/nickel transport system ATP-binding protein